MTVIDAPSPVQGRGQTAESHVKAARIAAPSWGPTHISRSNIVIISASVDLHAEQVEHVDDLAGNRPPEGPVSCRHHSTQGSRPPVAIQ